MSESESHPHCPCGDLISPGQPMTQVRHGFCDGETIADLDGSRAEDDIDYVVNYHAECYAENVLVHVPTREDNDRIWTDGRIADFIESVRMKLAGSRGGLR